MNSRKVALASKLSTPITFFDRHLANATTTITNYRLDGIPHDLYVKLVRCNMGSHGCMQNLLKTMFNEWSEDGWVSVCTDDQDNLLGWGLVYTMPLRGTTVCDFHVYVRKQHRRRHVGSVLCIQCRRIADEYFDTKIHVSPHDQRSRSFFVENKIPTIHWRK